MSVKFISKLQNALYTALVLIFAISSLVKTEYNNHVPVDFAAYSSKTEISLIINPKVPKSIAAIRAPNDFTESCIDNSKTLNKTKLSEFYNIKLNRYLFPQIILSSYLNSDFTLLTRIVQKYYIAHQYKDDTDPIVS